MSPAPTLTSAGTDLYGRMSPWATQDPDNGYALAWLCYAAGTILQQTYEAGVLGFENLDNPDTTPVSYLQYLGMRNGVRFFPQGLTEAQQRARVRSTDGLRRGTVEAMLGAARQHLTGDQQVTLLERTDPDNSGDQPYHLTVITYTDETPYPDLSELAIREQKPVGLVLHYLVIDGWNVLLLETTYSGQTVGDLEGDFATVYDLETNQP